MMVLCRVEFEFVESGWDCCWGGFWFGGVCGEVCHGFFGEVAAVGDLPFVVGFDEDGGGEAE